MPEVVGGMGSTSWYGDHVGRDVNGDMDGLGAAGHDREHITRRRLVGRASFVSLAALMP
jgi:hypothetical protein